MQEGGDHACLAQQAGNTDLRGIVARPRFLDLSMRKNTGKNTINTSISYAMRKHMMV